MVTVYNTRSTGLAVKWSHVPKQYFQGRPIGYKIVFYPVDLGSRDFNSVSVKYSTNATTLTDLAVDTIYTVQVSAVSSGGEGPAKRTIAETGRRTYILLLVSDWFTCVNVRKSIVICLHNGEVHHVQENS